MTSAVVLAPHCDDETLAAGGFMSLATRRRIPVRVVIVTNGDGFNPYALGSQHRRLRPTPEQYIQFAYRRQAEALQALQHLGVDEDEVTFLGYPDRGLAAMWGEYWEPTRLYRSKFTRVDRSPYRNSLTPGAPFCGRALVDDLKRVFREARPSHVITPHPHDSHSDHWATYCFSLYALEELAHEGEPFARDTCILAYLTHRGRWPRPSGFRPRLVLSPPRQYHRLPLPWVTLDLPPEAVADKHRALLAYRSQLRYMRAYLMSFVRRNELFGLFAPVPVPLGVPGHVLEGAEGWRGPSCQILDPVPPSWAGRVQRSADIRSVEAVRDHHALHLRMNLRSRPSRDFRYCVTLMAVGSPARSPRARNRLDVEVRPPGTVDVRAEGEWHGRIGYVACRVRRHEVEVTVPLDVLGHPRRLFLGAETRYGRLVLDQVPWHTLGLDGEGIAAFSPAVFTAGHEDVG